MRLSLHLLRSNPTTPLLSSGLHVAASTETADPLARFSTRRMHEERGVSTLSSRRAEAHKIKRLTMAKHPEAKRTRSVVNNVGRNKICVAIVSDDRRNNPAPSANSMGTRC